MTVNKKVKAEIINSALKDLHSNETLERAIGRFVRNARGSYDDYVQIMSDIREISSKKKISLLKAAEKLAESYES